MNRKFIESVGITGNLMLDHRRKVYVWNRYF